MGLANFTLKNKGYSGLFPVLRLDTGSAQLGPRFEI